MKEVLLFMVIKFKEMPNYVKKEKETHTQNQIKFMHRKNTMHLKAGLTKPKRLFGIRYIIS